MSLAVEWVARITAVALTMCVPGIAGQWLDARLQTGFFTLAGFAFGFCAGFTALLTMVNGHNRKFEVKASETTNNSDDQDDGTRER